MRLRVLILTVLAVLVTGLGPPAPAEADAAPQTSVQGAAVEWAPWIAYTAGTIVTYNGVQYRCLVNHTSLPGWEPPNNTAMWESLLPTAPANPRVTGVTAGSVSLAWDASTGTVTGYRVYEGGTQRAQVTATTLTATFSGLGKCETHNYTIKAYNAYGESVGGYVSATTLGCVRVPWDPATAYTAGTVVIYDGVVYQCQLSHTSMPGWEPPNASPLWKAVRAWELAVAYAAGTVVTYNGFIYQALQNHTSAPAGRPDAEPSLWQRVPHSDDVDPSFPANLRVTGTTLSSVSLAWDASTDNVRLAGYEVYRNAALVTTVTGTGYTDSGLTPSTAYTYMLRARDSSGNRSAASWLTATTAPVAPGQPGNPWATATATGITLNWSTAGGVVAGYRVYEGATQRAQVTATTLTATLAGLSPCETRKYTIKAYNVSGESPGRDLSAITTGCTGPNPNPAKLPGAPYLSMGVTSPSYVPAIMGTTGVKSFTMAFIQSAGGNCSPAWDGARPLTGGPDAAAISAITSRGGRVEISFGGPYGNKLGPNCSTPTAYANAVQQVISVFGPAVTVVDFDMEDIEWGDYLVQDLILNALKIVKTRNPNVKISVTIPTLKTGLHVQGLRLVNQAKALGVPIDVYTIMAYDFGGKDMYQDTVNASEGLKSTLKSVFGWSDAEAYAHMGISGMNTMSNRGEPTTPAMWTQIRDWARVKGLARLSFWAVHREPSGWPFSKITADF
ncbi:carbohydrate-binding protein [Spongiactinospora sp. TRM90649]|uniref:carbohydrate-binding protein n=1 Tax=Spongiactinospora sp. TRM90649 TaxID=3031114 RepID=UPI0023FA01CF|nr:carbohydrate-binding protein [Spongiactinospora sp. TRM90649]MDF5752429.1 fibronectin type III domain-containing protein [Spongiactinospora sp. TRM90649]